MKSQKQDYTKQTTQNPTEPRKKDIKRKETEKKESDNPIGDFLFKDLSLNFVKNIKYDSKRHSTRFW